MSRRCMQVDLYEQWNCHVCALRRRLTHPLEDGPAPAAFGSAPPTNDPSRGAGNLEPNAIACVLQPGARVSYQEEEYGGLGWAAQPLARILRTRRAL